MAAGPKADPHAVTRDRVLRLTAHLQKVKERMQSGGISKKHESRAQAYKEWIKLEYDRTLKKLEELKLTLPAAK